MWLSRFALPPSLFLVFFFLLFSLSAAEMTGNFKCEGTRTCRALVGYKSRNATTFGALQTLFSVRDLESILGANDLPLSITRGSVVRANQTIRIPIPCVCANGTGVSNRVPEYTVVKDDTLYGIASGLFRGLVQYQRIGELNTIVNNSLIEVGQKLWIPLPCSCDKVDGHDVVHYAHVVEPGSAVGEIAAQFGTENATLLNLNGITGDSELLAEYAFDVPLKACNSSVRNDSLDSPFLLANGSYIFTANNCVRCTCEASKDWTLNCAHSSQLKPLNWTTCPSTRCEGAESLVLGSSTSGSCRRSCSYAGYSSQTIFTTLTTDPTCQAHGSGNHASTLQSTWKFWLASVQLALISYFLLLQ